MNALQQKNDQHLLKPIYATEIISIAIGVLTKKTMALTNDPVETELEQLANNETGREVDADILAKDNVRSSSPPAVYSQRAIYVFSILCSVFFGALMLAYNLRKAGRPFGMAIYLGIGYTGLEIYLFKQFDGTLAYTFIANSLGAIVLYQLFWNSWIDKGTKYRTKPIWVPLIVALILFVPQLLLIIAQTWA